jgi:hypothetical protein
LVLTLMRTPFGVVVGIKDLGVGLRDSAEIFVRAVLHH